jgi:hypothetical protein
MVFARCHPGNMSDEENTVVLLEESFISGWTSSIPAKTQ